MMMSTKPVVGLVKQVTVAQGGNHTADGDLESLCEITNQQFAIVHAVRILMYLISPPNWRDRNATMGNRSRTPGLFKKVGMRNTHGSVCAHHPTKFFCCVCCSARSHNLVTFSKRNNLTFVEGGFCNWKKALQRFTVHEKSEMHRETMMKLTARSSIVDAGIQLSTQHDVDMKNHRAMFLKRLECVRYLARQGLPFRGHHEDSVSLEGNLLQLLLLQAKDCAPLCSWLKKREYISPEIINEVITICGQMILRQLLKDIYAADNFTLIADEATDISHSEQMCIAIRWVDCTYNIYEEALGLVQLPDIKALTLFSVIKDVLVRCSLPISNCIGQVYNGAANMSGIRNGIQALMKKEADHCRYVHCFAHSLNLCVQDVTKKCELLRNCMAFIFQLVQLIKFSPKRLNLFESMRKEISLSEGESALIPSLRTLPYRVDYSPLCHCQHPKELPSPHVNTQHRPTRA